jgi:hypothetical protein
MMRGRRFELLLLRYWLGRKLEEIRALSYCQKNGNLLGDSIPLPRSCRLASKLSAMSGRLGSSTLLALESFLEEPSSIEGHAKSPHLYQHQLVQKLVFKCRSRVYGPEELRASSQ